MNKLVSKNPILRFKLGRKIPKAQGGVWDTVKNHAKKILDNGDNLASFLANPYYGIVHYGTKEGVMKPAYNYGKGLIKKAYNSAKDWVSLTPDVEENYSNVGNSISSSINSLKAVDKLVKTGNYKRDLNGNLIKVTKQSSTITSTKTKPRSGWSYGYDRSGEISDITGTLQMLIDKGYLTGVGKQAADGKWGTETENAYKKFLLNRDNPVVAPTILQISETPLNNTIHEGFTQVMNTPPIIANLPKLPIRNGNYNKAGIRDLIRQAGFKAYDYTGALRAALRRYLNGESDDTSLLDGTDLARFTLPFRKQGGRLVSRNPIKRFKQGGISSFGKAFREARAAGLKEFEWNGKKYHTRTKEEEDVVSKPKTETSSPAPIRKQSPDISPDTLKYRLQKDDFYFGGFKDGLSNSSFKKALPKSYKAGYNDSKKK